MAFCGADAGAAAAAPRRAPAAPFTEYQAEFDDPADDAAPAAAADRAVAPPYSEYQASFDHEGEAAARAAAARAAETAKVLLPFYAKGKRPNFHPI